MEFKVILGCIACATCDLVSTTTKKDFGENACKLYANMVVLQEDQSIWGLWAFRGVLLPSTESFQGLLCECVVWFYMGSTLLSCHGIREP